MKFLLSTLTATFLLTSAAQAACPNLAGRYRCTGTLMAYDGTITQSVQAGKTTYAVVLGEGRAAMRFVGIADGVPRSETQDGTRLVTTATCTENGVLEVVLEMSNSADRYSLVTDTKWRRLNDSTLRVNFRAVERDRGAETEFNDRFACIAR